MIEHELLLLGLLRESPKHGYEIKIKIKELLSLFAGVELKSIYYPLRILEEKGLVIKKASKPGNRPERFVYTLTQKGKSHFNQLLARSFLNFKRPQFSLDLSLYFLKYINPSMAKRRLKARMHLLDKLSEELQQMIDGYRKKSPSLAHILEHDIDMVKTESDFLGNFVNTL